MSDIIMIPSSDEDEEQSQPPAKRIKPIHVSERLIKECTLTPISTPKKEEKTYAFNGETFVELDDSDNENRVLKSNKDKLNNKAVTNGTDTRSAIDTLHETTVNNQDAQEDKGGKKNTEIRKDGKSRSQVNSENPILLLDDSEEELDTPKANLLVQEISSEGETEKENNKSQKNSPNSSPVTKLFKQFLKLVEETIADSQFEEVFPKKIHILQKYFKRCSSNIINSSSFVSVLEENYKKVNQSAAIAVICFHKVFEHVKIFDQSFATGVPEEHVQKLKKLEKVIKLLLNKIHQLEEAEVDFDEDEDSAYLQMDRYTQRLQKVYNKYCHYLKRNPYSGRITHDRIDFMDSSYNEINLAINKIYKNCQKFPSYYEIEKFIANVAEKENLGLSEPMIKLESEKCFKKLGEILQKRRKTELYDSHCRYIQDSEDPAEHDNTLDNMLRKNFVEGNEKIEKLCQKYVTKQELGEEAELSDEDSSRSYQEESEGDDEEQTKNDSP